MIRLDNSSPFSFAWWILPMRFSKGQLKYHGWFFFCTCLIDCCTKRVTPYLLLISVPMALGFMQFIKFYNGLFDFFLFWVPILQGKWQKWQKIPHSILKEFFLTKLWIIENLIFNSFSCNSYKNKAIWMYCMPNESKFYVLCD